MFKYFFITVILFTLSAVAGAEPFVAGKDYVLLKNGKTHNSPHAIEVTEFFSYGCPWCYRIDASLKQWALKQGSAVSFHKVPVIFHKDWVYYAKAYYTAKALALNSQLDKPLFKAILKDKTPLNSEQAMVDFFIDHGVEKETVQSAFTHSPEIELNLAAGQKLMGQYQINAVPALVINGQFKTDLQMAKSETRLLTILDYLVKKSKD